MLENPSDGGAMNHRIPPFRLLVLLLCVLSACQTWKVQSAPPAEVLATTQKQVRLNMADGTRHTVNLARVERDSIVGVHPRPTRPGENTLSYALADVRSVELGEISGARTSGLIFGIVAGGWMLIGIFAGDAFKG